MDVTRRGFLTGTAATATVALGGFTFSLGGFIADKKATAWELYQRVVEINIRDNGKLGKPFSNELLTAGDEWLGFVYKNFSANNTQKIIDDVGIMLRSNDPVPLGNVSDEVFAVAMVRDALKFQNIPVMHFSRWRTFASRYTTIVMAA